MKLRKVINASGKMSILGVSRVSEAVSLAQKQAGESFYVMEELVDYAGEIVSEVFGYESGVVVNSAAAGIAQSVAASIGKDSLVYLENPYDPNITKREIIIPSGHMINFGAPISTMIQLGGGKVIEAGTHTNCSIKDIEECIQSNTSALMYVKSHHCVQDNMPTLKEMCTLSKQYQIPLILDAAAEEDISSYARYNLDFVIFSGAKAIEGPTSGIVLGKKETIDWVKLQSKGIARAMKIGKENIMGLLAAVESYATKKERTKEEQLDILSKLQDQLNTYVVSSTITQDSAGRNIYRLELEVYPGSVDVLIHNLEDKNPAIYTRNYKRKNNRIEIDIRCLNAEEIKILAHRLEEELKDV